MSGTVIPISMWPQSRMQAHLNERLNDAKEGEGIWMDEDHFYAAAFFLGIPIQEKDRYEFFYHAGHNWFNGDYDG